MNCNNVMLKNDVKNTSDKNRPCEKDMFRFNMCEIEKIPKKPFLVTA